MATSQILLRNPNPMTTKTCTRLCLLLILCALPFRANAQAFPAASAKPVVATIDTTKVSRPVSRYEYGMFIEHIGPLVYRSLWSEMLNDRKFYFPIEPAKPGAAKPAPTGFRSMFVVHKWRPVGPATAVTMDPCRCIRRRSQSADCARHLHAAGHPPERTGGGKGQALYRLYLFAWHRGNEGHRGAELGQRSRRPAGRLPSPR